MKNISSRFLQIMVLCMGLYIGPTPVRAAGQFRSTLDNPARVVSDYFTDDLSFSTALGSRTYAEAMPGLTNTPRLIEADFESHSLEFNTDYFRTQPLIPVSVDADAFLNYRSGTMIQRRLGENVVRDVVQAQRSQRRQGLSVGINLPKRFDNVFGEGGANLKVSGFRRISFSGRSQWTGGADSGPFRQSRFPSLNMEQISRFDIVGTIGTKISVSVSQDSQTDIPLSNRLQLRYKGDDDDVLQTIEAGNTNLNLSNTRFVGYSSRIQGLFGIKAEAQLGNLHLTAIASQEKGSSERSSVSATGEQSVSYIRDYAYVQGRIFDLPGERPAGMVGAGTWGKNDSVVQLYVYEHDIRDSLETDSATIYVDSINESSITRRQVKVKELGRDDFEWVNDPIRNLHYVVFRSQRREGLAVYMEIARYDDNLNFIGKDTVGAQPETGALQLKFIRALTIDFNVNHPTWKLMWRNAYAIPRGTTTEDLKLRVFKGLQGREGTSGQQDFQENSGANSQYITILGLDQLNDGTSARIPDNRLDDRREVFRPDWGLVIFPEREPFNSTRVFTDSTGVTTTKLAVRLDNIYNYASASEQTERSEYYLAISSAGARSNTIRLNRANIIEGSERVTVNGRLLTRGVDYNIQYDFGQVTLLSEDATDPNAELNIDFEYAPFLAVQKKSLLGMRAEYQWSRDFSFGTTVLFKSDKTQDRKPRVGQETSKGLVADFDLNLRLRPKFITGMVNALPLVQTEALSSIQISAEVAKSKPNPNVEGQAFVDDFESAIENVSLGLTRSSWKLSSKPVGLDNSFQRGRMLWHQIGRIPWEDVFDSQSPTGQNGIIPLRIIFRPNNDFKFRDSAGQAARIVAPDSDTKNWWGGLTRAFGNRLDAKRLQLFEMRVRTSVRSGILHLDFGKISEDTDGDGGPDTEDLDANRSITIEEDIGLDHLADIDEPGYDADTLPDPSGDNWYHQGEGHCPLPASLCNNAAFVNQLQFPENPLFAEWLNGTDGNREDVEFFQQPDEEKFSTAGHSLTNAYFSFEVDLDSGVVSDFEVLDSRNDFGWVTYRVPIRDTNLFQNGKGAKVVSEGEPADWANVTHVRIWYEAPAGENLFDTLEIATWGFVQSNWQDSLVTPTGGAGTFFVASVSEDENRIFDGSNIPYDAYVSPIDNVTEPRRALSLIYDKLEPDDTGFVTKDLVTTESYTGYRNLQMYVYAPPSVSQDSLTYFFRLGLDENNFYEFSTLLKPLWDEGNWVNIDFNEITALKDSALRALARPNDPVSIQSGKYRIKGRPNLNEVRFFAAGIVNNGPGTASGEIWMDELRLTDVRADVGTAARVNVTGSLADLATYGFSIDHKDPFFRGLSSVTRGGGNNNLGSGQNDDRFSFNTSVNFDKFLPKSWKARIPISFTYNKSTRVPLVRTNSDIVLPESVRQAEKTTSVSKTARISESFSKSGKNPLFTVLLNRQRTSISYSRTERSSPTNPFSLSENYNIRSDYNMGIRSMPRLPIFFWAKSIPILKKTSESRLGLFPDTWRWSATFNRSLSITDDTQLKRVTSRRRDFDGRMNLSYRLFDNLTTSATYNTRRDLTDPDLIKFSLSPSKFKLGLETNFGQSVRADYSPQVVNFLTTSFNYSATYNDVLDRSSSTRRSNLARTIGVSGRFDHLAFLGGKSRGGGRRGGSNRSSGSGRSLRRTAVKHTPLYLKPVAGLRFLTKWINPLTYRYSETYNSSVPSMLARPSLRYRIGLTRDVDVPFGQGDTRNPSSREGKSYELSSGFTLFGGISTDARYRKQDNQDIVKIGNRSKRSSTNWPDLTIRIRRFTYFPLLKKYINKFINVFSPRTGFTRSTREDFNLDGGFLTNKTVSTDRNPLLAVNLKLIRSLSMSGSFSTSQNNVQRFNQTNGSIRSESRSDRKTLAVSTKYSFSAPGGIALPIFGRLKFASTVSIDLNVRYNTNKTETSQAGNPFRPTRDQTDLSVTPIISYTFSRQIRGGISGLWQDTNDRLNRVSHIRQLQIWTEIRF